MTTNQRATKFAALMSPGQSSEPETVTRSSDHGLCLVVADRGHVWVGRAVDQGDYTIVEDARIVRRWGSESGLNQIAVEGPKDGTQLDAPATVKVAQRAIIAIIPCSEAAWKGK